MADGVVLNAGSGGVTAATDDCGAAGHAQVVKLAISTDGSATAIPADGTNGLQVNVTKSVPGTGATNLGKAEDDAHASGDVGVLALAVRRDTAAVGSGTDGDNSTLNVNASGRLYTSATVDAALPAGNNNIGDVDIASIAAGDNNIGNVDVVTLPALPAGANTIGAVNIAAAQTLATVTTVGTVTTITNAVTVVGAAAEDAAASGNPVLAGGRYDSTPRTLETGDVGAVALNASGQVLVEIAAGAGSGGTAAADDADFTAGTTSGTPVMGVYESSPTSVTDGDLGTVGITQTRALKVAIASGGVSGKAEDAAHSSGDEGIVMLAVRRDTAAVGSGTDGDYSTVNVNASGRVYTSATVDAALPAGTNNIGDVDVLTLPNVTLAAGTNTNEVVGDAAHDAAIAGNPLRIAGRALTADYTAVAAGDTADLITTLLGKLVTIPYANPNQSWNYAAPAGGLVSTTAVTIKAAAGAGIRNYITHIDCVNSHATISTELMILDGAAGTVLWRGWLQAAGGGYSINFDPPLRGTANTLLEIDEVTATGTAGVLFNATGFVAAE